MTYTIYSVGDGAFLAKILNAVAMMMGDHLATVAAIGLLLGFVFAVIGSIMDGGQKLSISGPAVAFVAYLVLFTPSVPTVVYDVRTWRAHPVDNVPLGVAATGMTLSHLGYYITSIFKTAYSKPGMLQTGYMTPLEMLLVVRSPLGAATSISEDDNFLQTLSNYINGCTDTGILLGELNPAAIQENPDLWKAIEFPSQTYAVKTYLPSDPAGGAAHTCNEAYSMISNQWPDRIEAWGEYLSDKYEGELNGASVQAVIQGALDNYVKLGLSGDQYMKNAIIMNALERVAHGTYSQGSYGATVMITQATEQARVQFAAEASMFARYAVPLMTFVEGFFYSLVPFMVFVAGFGMAGFKLIGRYILILLWVQLWMPILSITDMFIKMSFAGEMDYMSGASGGSGIAPLSLIGMQELQSEVADWIAVGGNLIAATPALALVVLYGGAYTMVNLAGRLSPSDQVDESQLAPAAFTNPGSVAMSPAMEYNPTEGMTQTAASAAIGSVALSKQLGQATQSSHQEAVKAQESYGNFIAQSYGTAYSQADGYQELARLGQSVDIASNTAYSNMMERAEHLGEKYGWGQTTTNAIKSTLAAEASGTIGTGKAMPVLQAGVGARLGLELTGAGSEGSEQATDLQELVKEASSETVRQSWDEAVSIAAQDTDTQSFEAAAKEQNEQGFKESRERMILAQNAYEQVESLQNNVGNNQTVPITALATDLADDSQAMGDLHDFLNTHDRIDNQVQNRVDELQQDELLGSYEANENRYLAAAAFDVLPSYMSDSDARDQFIDMVSATNLVGDGAAPDNVNPDEYQGVGGHVMASTSGLVDRVDAHTDAAQADIARQNAAQTDETVRANNKEIDYPGERTQDEMASLERGKGYWGENAEAATDNTGIVGQKAVMPAFQALEQAADVPTGTRIAGAVSGVGLMAQDFAQDLRGKLSSGNLSQDEAQQRLDQKLQGISQNIEGNQAAQSALVSDIVANMTEVREDQYQAALDAGLTPVGAALSADASVYATAANLQDAVPAVGALTQVMDEVSDRLGYDLNANIEDAMREAYGGMLYRQEMEFSEGDEVIAQQTAQAKFERITEAAMGGSYGGPWLNPVATLTEAQEIAEQGDPDNYTPSEIRKGPVDGSGGYLSGSDGVDGGNAQKDDNKLVIAIRDGVEPGDSDYPQDFVHR